MSIEKEELQQIAKLAKLTFSEEEEMNFIEKLNQSFQMIDGAKEIDITGVEMTRTPSDLTNQMRPDKAILSENQEAILANIPSKNAESLSVPVIGMKREELQL